MADLSRLVKVGGSATNDYQDTVTLTYQVTYDSTPTNFYNALIRAQTAAGTPVPVRRSVYGGGSVIPPPYCTNLQGEMQSDDHRAVWQWTATFTVPPPGEQDEEQQNENPLLRPPVFNIRYMERERVIDKAKNVQALSHGDGSGGNRAALTEGPIVNAAGKRPDEPLVDTDRLEILVIEKNFASLAQIVTRNRTYKATTNSDTVQGYSPRELRYLMTESVGKQFENGIEFWPGVTEILAGDTDLTLDNVGYEYWDAGESNWKRAVDADNEFMAEPINLKLDGDQGGTNATTITYRYLEEISYASLFT